MAWLILPANPLSIFSFYHESFAGCKLVVNLVVLLFIKQNNHLATLFWISLFIIFYTYIGYGLILFFMVRVLRWVRLEEKKITELFTPSLALIVAAYNEADCIEEKIKNSLSLQYPVDKIHFIFVTDGSTDGTPEIVSRYPRIQLLHTAVRSGKIAALQRAMKEVKTEVVVFTDANSVINKDALLQICQHYRDEKTGAVAGEKRIDISKVEDATAGEGFYWKYESILKKWESELYSVIGAAGELFSIRTALYETIEPDTILDDFMISMRISVKGYLIRYEPGAYAVETASVNISEELKRKVRIATGAVQAMLRLKSLLLPFRYPVLSFEYISHRILRWIITPYLLIAAFVLNGVMVLAHTSQPYFAWILFGQSSFYSIALMGRILEKRQLAFKIWFIPYYFCLMNYAMIAGMFRFMQTKQTVLWEKAKRK